MVHDGSFQLRHGGTRRPVGSRQTLLLAELSFAVPRQPAGEQWAVGGVRPLPQARASAVSSHNERRLGAQLLQLSMRRRFPGLIYYSRLLLFFSDGSRIFRGCG